MRTSMLLLALAIALAETDATRRDADFERDVRPILARRCFECHGSEKQKGKLRFDRRRGVFKANEEDQVIRPGAPDESELLIRVRLPAEDLDAMPPEGPRLTLDEIETLRAWIEAGAEWPADPAHLADTDETSDSTPAPEVEASNPVSSGASSPVAFADVRKLLAANCLACHGPDEAQRKAGLRLDKRAGLTAARKHGAVVVPGNANASLLIERVRHADEDERMPPIEAGPRLRPGEIDLLRRWIDDGAKWEEHWSFQPLRERTPPELELDPSARDFVRNEIDRFVVARLADEGLTPSPVADRYTLARRASLDLTGLPPDPADVDAFVASEARDAYDRYVTRLLADPAFGERWATVWLDVARYADTKGYEKDARRTIWPYRDWVIRAINGDMPFDRFTRTQLAGDLLPDATDESVLATAFHRNTMTNDEGGTDDEEFRVAAVVDRVNTTMQVWMGLSFGCAQCHSHKFDPITNREYYEVFDVFNQTEDADRDDDAPLLLVPDDEQRDRLRELEASVASAEEVLAREKPFVDARASSWIDEVRTAAHSAPENYLIRKALDEVEGEMWLDGDPAFVSGVIGRAASFDGERAIEVGAEGDFERDQAFTASLWLRRDGDGVQVPLAKMDSPAEHRGWDVYVDNGRVSVHLIHAWPDNALKVTTRDAISAGVWTHIAVTSDGSASAGGVSVYLNGRLSETTASHDSLTDTIRTERPLVIGRRNGSASMIGAVDDVRLYARALGRDAVRVLVRFGAAQLANAQATDATETALTRIALAADDAYYAASALRTAAVEAANAERAAIPNVPVMRRLADDALRTTRIQRRGNYRDLGDEVRAGTPAAFTEADRSNPASAARPPGRLEFADWLVNERNPLTARVQVNRVWEQLFGVGLVETSEDFGTQGTPPSHAALLDWLALEYMERGWSLKELCHLIVTSATYRQASRQRALAFEIDPNNRLLWRGPRFRLEAEMVRDQALAVSGLLSRTMYGPPVFPPQPDGVWNVVYSGDQWTADEGEDRHRRALYTFWRRTSPYPSLTTFDAPSREVCVARRIRTNTPLQALVTLNDPVFIEAAQALARRIARELPAAGPSQRAATAFRWCTGRPASDRETAALVELFRSEFWHYDEDPDAAGAMAGAAADGEGVSELAAWTVVGNVLLNLDEVLVKQ